MQVNQNKQTKNNKQLDKKKNTEQRNTIKKVGDFSHYYKGTHVSVVMKSGEVLKGIYIEASRQFILLKCDQDCQNGATLVVAKTAVKWIKPDILNIEQKEEETKK